MSVVTWAESALVVTWAESVLVVTWAESVSVVITLTESVVRSHLGLEMLVVVTCTEIVHISFGFKLDTREVRILHLIEPRMISGHTL